jgi:hypothetical protein
MTVATHKTPPKNIQQSKVAFFLAKGPHTFPSVDALYPPCGRHPSDPTMILSHTKHRSTSRPGRDTQMTKISGSCSSSVSQSSNAPHLTRGCSPPSKGNLFSIFNPATSTASTSHQIFTDPRFIYCWFCFQQNNQEITKLFPLEIYQPP